jgi:hypothetical protein
VSVLTASWPRCYEFEVPADAARTDVRWEGQVVGSPLPRVQRLFRTPPNLELSAAGLPTILTESPLSGHRLGKTERTRLAVRHSAARGDDTPVAAGVVATDFVSQLRPGDVLYAARGVNGCMAVSVLRDGELLAAAGAISAVPLGKKVGVTVPFDLAAAAHAVYRQHDPDFSYVRIPVRVTVSGSTRFSLGGSFDLGPYSVFVEHPYYDQTGAIDECAAISVRNVFSNVAANLSAQFLAFGGDSGL